MQKSNSCRDGATPCRCGRPSERDGMCRVCLSCRGTKSAAVQALTEDERIAQVMEEFK